MALAEMWQVKVALGIDPAKTDKDAQIALALEDAEDAVKDHTYDRWEMNDPEAAATARDFTFEESGVHTVNPFVHGSITAVQLLPPIGSPIDLTAPAYLYGPLPAEYPVGWWVETSPAAAGTGEMGFLQNLDVYLMDHPQRLSSPWKVRVTAKWGYTAIPPSVRRATIWTAVHMFDSPRPVSSESIAGYTRAYADVVNADVPRRAAKILESHVKQ